MIILRHLEDVHQIFGQSIFRLGEGGKAAILVKYCAINALYSWQQKYDAKGARGSEQKPTAHNIGNIRLLCNESSFRFENLV